MLGDSQRFDCCEGFREANQFSILIRRFMNRAEYSVKDKLTGAWSSKPRYELQAPVKTQLTRYEGENQNGLPDRERN